MNLIRLILKPALQKKFKFKELKTVDFLADYLKDTLNIEATGLNIDLETCKGETNKLKLSENKHYISMFEENLKGAGVRFKKIDFAKMEINFKTCDISTTVFYIDLNDLKQKTTVNTKF